MHACLLFLGFVLCTDRCSPCPVCAASFSSSRQPTQIHTHPAKKKKIDGATGRLVSNQKRASTIFWGRFAIVHHQHVWSVDYPCVSPSARQTHDFFGPSSSLPPLPPRPQDQKKSSSRWRCPHN
ncbi:hypothetical protein GQ54DRAFT_298788, partial [Martensiomyces pterosporus]